jgi:hypothetical protein
MYEKALATPGGIGEAPPPPSYATRAGAEGDVPRSDLSEQQRIREDERKMRESMALLLGPEAVAPALVPPAAVPPAAAPPEEEELEPTEARRIEQLERERQQALARQRQQAKLETTKEGALAQAKQTYELAQKTSKQLKYLWRAINGVEVATIVGIILAILTLALEVFNKRSNLRLPFVPIPNCLEEAVLYWVICGLCCSQVLQYCFPFIFLMTIIIAVYILILNFLG